MDATESAWRDMIRSRCDTAVADAIIGSGRLEGIRHQLHERGRLETGRQEDRLRGRRMTIETIIKGGLPVFASGDVYPAEPDVGIMTQYVDGVYVRFLSGHEFHGKLGSPRGRTAAHQRDCGRLQ